MLWLQGVLYELEVYTGSNYTSTSGTSTGTIYCDNQGTIDLVRNPRISDRSKHIDIAYHHVRDLYTTGKLTPQHIPGTDNPADICTKMLSGPKFKIHVSHIFNTLS